MEIKWPGQPKKVMFTKRVTFFLLFFISIFTKSTNSIQYSFNRNCKPLYRIPNGKVTCTSTFYKVYSRCFFNCHPGFVLSTRYDYVRCNRDRVWDNRVPSCVVDKRINQFSGNTKGQTFKSSSPSSTGFQLQNKDLNTKEGLYQFMKERLDKFKNGDPSLTFQETQIFQDDRGENSQNSINPFARSFSSLSNSDREVRQDNSGTCNIRITLKSLADLSFQWKEESSASNSQQNNFQLKLYTGYLTELTNNRVPIRSTKTLEFYNKPQQVHNLLKNNNNLKPETFYEFFIQKSDGSCSGKVVFKTIPLAPNFKISKITSSAIFLKLAEPEIYLRNGKNPDKTHFMLEIYSRNETKVADAVISLSDLLNQQNKNVLKMGGPGMLNSLQFYKLYAYESTDTYLTKPMTLTFKTMPRSVSILKSFTTDHSFQINWSKVPSAVFYHCELTDDRSKLITSTKISAANFDNFNYISLNSTNKYSLRPEAKYSIKIVALLENGHTDPVLYHFETRPLAPQLKLTIVRSTAVSMEWEDQEVGVEFQYYEIKYIPLGKDETFETYKIMSDKPRFLNLQDISPSSHISLGIRKVYSQIEKTAYNFIEKKIRIPQLPPKLEIFDVMSTSFELEWDAAENFTTSEGNYYPKYGFTTIPIIRPMEKIKDRHYIMKNTKSDFSYTISFVVIYLRDNSDLRKATNQNEEQLPDEISVYKCDPIIMRVRTMPESKILRIASIRSHQVKLSNFQDLELHLFLYNKTEKTKIELHEKELDFKTGYYEDLEPNTDYRVEYHQVFHQHNTVSDPAVLDFRTADAAPDFVIESIDSFTQKISWGGSGVVSGAQFLLELEDLHLDEFGDHENDLNMNDAPMSLALPSFNTGSTFGNSKSSSDETNISTTNFISRQDERSSDFHQQNHKRTIILDASKTSYIFKNLEASTFYEVSLSIIFDNIESTDKMIKTLSTPKAGLEPEIVEVGNTYFVARMPEIEVRDNNENSSAEDPHQILGFIWIIEDLSNNNGGDQILQIQTGVQDDYLFENLPNNVVETDDLRQNPIVYYNLRVQTIYQNAKKSNFVSQEIQLSNLSMEIFVVEIFSDSFLVEIEGFDDFTVSSVLDSDKYDFQFILETGEGNYLESQSVLGFESVFFGGLDFDGDYWLRYRKVEKDDFGIRLGVC